MRWLVVSLAVAVAPYAAWPQDQEGKETGKEQQQPTSDPHPGQESDDEQKLKSYGYGTLPGTEARSDSKQSTQPGRKASSAPQDERRDRRAAQGKERTLSGRVVSASPGSLSLEGEDRRVHRLQITENTEVLRGGERVKIGDLREGEDVRASFDVRGGERVATRIDVGQDASRQPPSTVDQGREDERRMRGERSEERDPRPSGRR